MPGTLMLIGGAEDKRGQRIILRDFVTHAGGSQARIVILPTASTIAEEIAADYAAIFADLGAGRIATLHVDDRRAADHPSAIQTLLWATGVFLSGGDQVRLMNRIGCTRVAAALRRAWRAGAAIAGTSAGAAVMSQQMIGFDRPGFGAQRPGVEMMTGLGLVEHLIVDQHFTQRRRLNRLRAAVALHPCLTGIGIDEDTALVILPDGKTRVIGTGSLTVVDGNTLRYSTSWAGPCCLPISSSISPR